MAVNATAVWRFRPSGSNTNGGGYDPGIAGAATDYSQQNAAQATGTNGAGSATTTFTDATAAAFTAAMVGNAINIAGQGFYFVVTFTDASHVVVDRALGTFSAASWKLGGAWGGAAANICTNLLGSGTVSPVVQGNIVYFLGSGTPNPAAYTYDYLCSGTGGQVFLRPTGTVRFLNDPTTPGYKAPPDTTGGMPTIQLTATMNNSGDYCFMEGLWFIDGGSTTNAHSPRTAASLFGCVYDQFGTTNSSTAAFVASGSVNVIACEVFSSVTGNAGNSGAIYRTLGTIYGCNIHDCTGGGIFTIGGTWIIGNIVAKCPNGDGIQALSGQGTASIVLNNTIDANGGNGIVLTNTGNQLAVDTVVNNIISNHTGAGKAGLVVNAGTTAANDALKQIVDYNVFYNNTSNYTSISASPHDTALGVTPYTASATENYTLA